MSWSTVQDLFDGQGVVFWAAVMAVTLGLTLLSVSIVFQVRKLLSGRKLGSKKTAVAPAATGMPRIDVGADSYEATGFLPDPVPAANKRSSRATDAVNTPGLGDVLTRLRHSADRLDRIHASLDRTGLRGASAGNSPLKPGLTEVDYVYKTGRA